MMSTGSEFVSTRVDMAPPSGSRPREQSVTVCSPISDGGGDLQLPKTSPGPERIPTKWSRPSNLVLPSHVTQPSGASPRDDFASDSSTTLENEASGDESGLSLGLGHPDDGGGGGGGSGDSEDPPEVEAKRPSRKRSCVLRFQAGSATIDNKLRQIGHGFVPVGRSPRASSGTWPDVANGGGAIYNSYSSPRKSGQPHGSPNRRRSNSIMSPAAFHQDSDLENDLEPEEKRERETIPPTDLPPVGAKAAYAFDEGSRLMWSPHPGVGADAFLAQARAIMKRRGKVLAYDTLLKYFMDAGHSMPAALKKLTAYHKSSSAAESGLGHAFDYWSEDEACQFEESYVNGGKDFPNISRALKTRSVAECVSFYYKWKKTVRGTEALMQHKRVLQQPLPFNLLKQLFIPMPDALHSDEDGNTSEAASKSRDGSPTPSAGDRVGSNKTEVAQIKLKRKRRRPIVNKTKDLSKDSATAAKKPKLSVPAPQTVPVPAPAPRKGSHKKGKGKSHKKKKPVESDIFIVESVLQSRMQNGQPEYKVKWQDYPLEHCTWEPLANLANNIVLKSYLFNQQKAAAEGRRLKA